MTRKLLAALLALLLIALPALAEGAVYTGAGYTVTLPEGLEVLPAETVRGYFEGAAADAGVDGEEPAVDYDAMMVAATADGKTSVNIIAEASDGRTAQEAAEAARAELLELVEGLSAAEVRSLTCGGTEFACMDCSLYGNDILQYFAVAGETLYCVTCTNLGAEAAEAMLASFAPEA